MPAAPKTAMPGTPAGVWLISISFGEIVTLAIDRPAAPASRAGRVVYETLG